MERGRWRRGWHHRGELDRTPSIPIHISYFVQNLPALWISVALVLLSLRYIPHPRTTIRDISRLTWLLASLLLASLQFSHTLFVQYLAGTDYPQARILDIPLTGWISRALTTDFLCSGPVCLLSYQRSLLSSLLTGGFWWRLVIKRLFKRQIFG